MRSKRPKLPELEGEPIELDRRNWIDRKFTLDPKRFEPGTYKLVVQVKDTTKLRGEELPWVLKDANGVLESRRAWTVQILGEPR